MRCQIIHLPLLKTNLLTGDDQYGWKYLEKYIKKYIIKLRKHKKTLKNFKRSISMVFNQIYRKEYLLLKFTIYLNIQLLLT